MPKFHVTFQDEKKVLIINKNEDFFTKFSQLFEVDHKPKALKLQMYDSEWEDYVDVEPEDLPEKAKILVRLRTRQKVPNIPPPSYEASTAKRVLIPNQPLDKTDDDCSIIGVNDDLIANKKDELLAMAKLLQPSLQTSTRNHYEPLFNSDRLQISGLAGVFPGQNSGGCKERESAPLFLSCDEPLIRLNNAGDKTHSEGVDIRSQSILVYPDSSNCIEKQNFSGKMVSKHSKLGTLLVRKNVDVTPLGSGLQQRTMTTSDPHKKATRSFPYSQLLTTAAKYSNRQQLAGKNRMTPDRTNTCKKVDRPQLGQSKSLADLLKVKKCVNPPATSTCSSKTFAEYILIEGGNGPSTDDVFPQPFILPIEKFPWNLRAALDDKIILWKDAKHQLLQSLYDYISPYTVYPKPYMYELACKSLIKAYPHLLDQCPMVLWRRMLSNKFRNERKRALQEHPSVIMNKRPASQQTSNSGSAATSQKNIKEPDDIEVLWPSPFLLPRKAFSEELIDAISTLDGPMSPKLQTLLLEELHKYVSTYSSCPNSYQCHEVASAILSTFSEISEGAKKSGLSYFQAEKDWAKLIVQKFEISQKTILTKTADVTVKAKPDFLTLSYCDMTDSMSSTETSSWYLVQSDVADNGQQAESQEGFLIQDKQISRCPSHEQLTLNQLFEKFPHIYNGKEYDDVMSLNGEGNSSWSSALDLLSEHFLVELKNALDSLEGEENGDLMVKVLEELYEFVSKITRDPTPSQCKEVAAAMLDIFPKLKEGITSDLPVTYWTGLIMRKFDMERGRRIIDDDNDDQKEEEKVTSSEDELHRFQVKLEDKMSLSWSTGQGVNDDDDDSLVIILNS